MDDESFDVYVPDVVSDEDIAYFEKSGFGARMGWGETPAVVVVDMTEEFTTEEYAAGRGDTGAAAVAGIKRLLETARDTGVPVYYTRPSSEHVPEFKGVWCEKSRGEVPETRPGNDINPELTPREDEILLEKGKPSAFFDTPLSSMLRLHGVDTVVVTGMVTSGCIRATVVDACSHNFRAIVPEECVADRARISHEVNLMEMDLKYADVLPLDDVVEKLEKLAEPAEASAPSDD